MSTDDTRSAAVTALVAAYVVLMPLGWPQLPVNLQLGDLVFPLLLVAALSAGLRAGLNRLDVLVVACLLGSAASIPGSLDARESLLAMMKGVYLAGAYFVLSAALPRVGVSTACRWLVAAVSMVAAASLAGGAIYLATGRSWMVLGEAMPLPYVGQVFRVTGTLQTPEFAGNLLTFAAPLAALFAWQTASGGSRWRAAFALIALAEVFTFSKSLGGWTAGVAMALWPYWRTMTVRRVATAMLAVTLIVAFNFAAWIAIRDVDVTFGKNPRVPPPAYLYGRQDDPAGADLMDVRISYNPMSYYLVKRVAWQAFRQHPWTGIGLSTFHLEAERAYQDGRLPQSYRRINAHSTPFGRLAETGLVGAVTLLLLLVGVWRAGIAASRGAPPHGALVWAVLAGIAGLLINSVNVDIMNFRFLWFGMAVIRALSAAPRDTASAS